MKKNFLNFGGGFIILATGITAFSTFPFSGGPPKETRLDNPLKWKEKTLNDWERNFTLADSSHSYDVLHYRLDLTFPMTSRSLSGTVLMKALAN